MAKIGQQTRTSSPPRFYGEWTNTNVNILPTGGKVDPDEFDADDNGRVFVPAGTPLGRNRGDALWIPGTEAHDEFYLSAYDIHDAADHNDVEFLKPGFIVKYNYLPGWDEIVGTVQDRIHEVYVTILGADE